MTEHNLSNHFLLALPVQANTYFEETVTLLIHHGEDGALGFVINRPTPVKIEDIIMQAELSPNIETDAVIMEGGPVSRTSPTVIHSSDFRADTTIEISDKIYCTSELQEGDIMYILSAIAEGRGPAQYLFFLGYAGWGPDQLENELETNSWITCPADTGILFGEPFATRFERVSANIGIDFDRIGPSGGSA